MIGQSVLGDTEASVDDLAPGIASGIVKVNHYLHRTPPISYSYGLTWESTLRGVVTFGVPASRHLQVGACRTDPDLVIELNRLWVDDACPPNTESWFVSRALRRLPPRIVVSYADTAYGHFGFVYRALNFRYAGWTDMDRRTPRFDYVPLAEGMHSREAMRSGWSGTQRRATKVRYWITTGGPADRRRLAALCDWPTLDWNTQPPPGES